MKKILVAKNELGIYGDCNGTARVDSLAVAAVFEKDHRNVIRDIRNLDCSDEFRLLNFEQSTYINEQGHSQPCFTMTRDGFVFLVIGTNKLYEIANNPYNDAVLRVGNHKLIKREKFAKQLDELFELK